MVVRDLEGLGIYDFLLSLLLGIKWLGILDYSYFHCGLICILGDCGIFSSRNIFALTISCPF